MQHNNEAIARGILAQLKLEEKEYCEAIQASPEYKNFTVNDTTTEKLDGFIAEYKDIEAKYEKLTKELHKLDLRKAEITEEAEKLTGNNFYYSSLDTLMVIKDDYIQKKRDEKFDNKDWYPHDSTFFPIILGHIETGNFTTFDAAVDLIRTRYQK